MRWPSCLGCFVPATPIAAGSPSLLCAHSREVAQPFLIFTKSAASLVNEADARRRPYATDRHGTCLNYFTRF